jgi:CRP-like cAMP-binding protein
MTMGSQIDASGMRDTGRDRPEFSITGLRRIALFGTLPDSALQRIARQCVWRRYHPNQAIISRNAADHDVYLIVSGIVRVTAFSGTGRQLTYRELGAGEWFGDLAAIDSGPRSADVLAQCEAVLAILSANRFMRLLADYPDVSAALLRHLVARVRDLSDRLFSLSTLGVQNRVHAELLRLARSSGIADNTARIDPAPRHVDIACQISTYREQVTRELTQLRKQGILTRDGAALVVEDIRSLERMVTEVRAER